jgi:hypothetical protein
VKCRVSLELDRLLKELYRGTVGILFEYHQRIAHDTSFAFVALALAITITPTPGEAVSQRIDVTAKVVQQTFTGNLASPKLGDRIISNVELFDDSDTKVGSDAGVCTIVSIQKTPGTPCHLHGASERTSFQVELNSILIFKTTMGRTLATNTPTGSQKKHKYSRGYIYDSFKSNSWQRS